MSTARYRERRWLRHPARRDGLIALVLFVLPTVAAVVLVLRGRPDIPTLIGLIALAAGLPVTWLTWAIFRDASRSAVPVSELTVAEAADQLARAIGTQWSEELVIRRAYDPWLLPVSWVTADASFTDSWDSIIRLASSGGWPTPQAARRQPTEPPNLAGSSRELAEILGLIPTSRLVVLGEPGAGKSMLVTQLVLDLLARRVPGGPVPFLTSVASWNPVEQELKDWLADQLVIGHSSLAAAPLPGTEEPTQAAAILAAGLILPILDGFDEIPDQVRGPAIDRINGALLPGQGLVVTCREQQFREAVRPENGIAVNLRGAMSILLRPLDAQIVRSYLCEDASTPEAQARWRPVLNALGTNSPVGQALKTPLMVGLARTIYNPRPGELIDVLRNPAELCDPVLIDRQDVESLLFDAFIPASYRNTFAGSTNSQDPERWLMFLAHHLEYRAHSPDLAWWQLPLAQVTSSPRRWLPAITWALRWVFDTVPVAALVGPIGFGASALADGVSALRRRTVDPSYIDSTVSPTASLELDRKAAVSAAIRSGITAGVLIGIAIGIWVGILHGKYQGAIFAAAYGAAAGALAACFEILRRAWLWYEISRIWLTLNKVVPWQVMNFLADAHKRGVLRQIGAVYQFRHIELQRRLADRQQHPQGKNTLDEQRVLCLTALSLRYRKIRATATGFRDDSTPAFLRIEALKTDGHEDREATWELIQPQNGPDSEFRYRSRLTGLGIEVESAEKSEENSGNYPHSTHLDNLTHLARLMNVSETFLPRLLGAATAIVAHDAITFPPPHEGIKRQEFAQLAGERVEQSIRRTRQLDDISNSDLTDRRIGIEITCHLIEGKIASALIEIALDQLANQPTAISAAAQP
jgi:hypothetical protein